MNGKVAEEVFYLTDTVNMLQVLIDMTMMTMIIDMTMMTMMIDMVVMSMIITLMIFFHRHCQYVKDDHHNDAYDDVSIMLKTVIGLIFITLLLNCQDVWVFHTC